MKNKFNIGDRVMIRTDLEVLEKYGELTLLDSMAEHCGTISEIAHIRARVNSSCCYILKGVGPSFGLSWLWSEEMLEKVEEEALENSKKPKFKKGDSVKVTEQFADVKTGYYQVLDVLYINEKSWYTLKGAPMIWVPEENLETSGPKCVYQSWTRPIVDMCRFKQEKDAEFVSTEANPGYVVDFLPTAGCFGSYILRSPCIWVPTFSTFNLADECAEWINNKYNL